MKAGLPSKPRLPLPQQSFGRLEQGSDHAVGHNVPICF